MIIGNKEFDVENKSYIMGILNVTPDSFSDGGKWNELDRAFKHTEEMIDNGAAIIDIGGESTRPGYVHVSAGEEIERVLPYIEGIKKRFDVPISIDTYKAPVALAAVKGGADLINDIWGFKGDENMASVAAKLNVPCCIMHNRDIDKNPYKDLMNDVLSDIRESVDMGLKAGVKLEMMISDPGKGFGKMIGLALDLPVEERVEGTIATTVMGVMKGCAFIRVHDVKENYRALRMTEKILGRS